MYSYAETVAVAGNVAVVSTVSTMSYRETYKEATSFDESGRPVAFSTTLLVTVRETHATRISGGWETGYSTSQSNDQIVNGVASAFTSSSSSHVDRTLTSSSSRAGTLSASGSTTTTRDPFDYLSTTATRTSYTTGTETTVLGVPTTTETTVTAAYAETTSSYTTTESSHAGTTVGTSLTTTTRSRAATRTTSATTLAPFTLTVYLIGTYDPLVHTTRRILEAQPREHAWHITDTSHKFGYASEVGSTFSKTTVFHSTSALTAPAGITGTGTHTTTVTVFSSRTTQLTTTLTAQFTDTVAVANGVYPATSTEFAGATLLRTSSTTRSVMGTTTATVSFTGATNTSTFSVTGTIHSQSLIGITVNGTSPAATAAAAFHVTYTRTTTLAGLYRADFVATSSSTSSRSNPVTSASWSEAGTYTVSTNTTRTTSHTLTETNTDSNATVSTTVQSTTTYFVASQFNTDTCAVAAGAVDEESISGQVFVGLTTVNIFKTSHDATLTTTNTTTQGTQNVTVTDSQTITETRTSTNFAFYSEVQQTPTDQTITSSTLEESSSTSYTTDAPFNNTWSEYYFSTVTEWWTSYTASTGISITNQDTASEQWTTSSQLSQIFSTSHSFLLMADAGVFVLSSSSTGTEEAFASDLVTFSTTYITDAWTYTYTTTSLQTEAVATTQTYEQATTKTTWIGDHTMVTETWNWETYQKNSHTSAFTYTSLQTGTQATTTSRASTSSVFVSTAQDFLASYAAFEGREMYATIPRLNLVEASRTEKDGITAFVLPVGPGFMLPTSMELSDVTYSALTINGVISFYYPHVATVQRYTSTMLRAEDFRTTTVSSFGNYTPILYTDSSSYSTLASRYTVRYDTSDDAVHFTSSVTTTTDVSTGTFIFNGHGPRDVQQWHSVAHSRRNLFAVSEGGETITVEPDDETSYNGRAFSVVGGIPARSQASVQIIVAPGILNGTEAIESDTFRWQTTFTAPSNLSAAIGNTYGLAIPDKQESHVEVFPAGGTIYRSAGGIGIDVFVSDGGFGFAFYDVFAPPALLPYVTFSRNPDV